MMRGRFETAMVVEASIEIAMGQNSKNLEIPSCPATTELVTPSYPSRPGARLLENEAFARGRWLY